MPIGDDTTVRVGIEGDADEAAAKIEQQIADAFADALKSPKVRAAFAAVAKNIGNQINKSLDASLGKPFASAGRDAKRVLGNITSDLQKVARAADKAFAFGESQGSRAELQAVNATVSAIARNFEELKNASSATLRTMEEEGRQTRAALAAVLQESRRGTDAEIQQRRERAAILQREQTAISAAARVEAATISARSQRNVQFYRTIRELSVSTWRGAGQAVTAFARTVDRVLSGVARGIAATFRGIGNTVRTTVTGISRAFAGIGRGVSTALAGVSRAIASALRRDENAYRTSLSRRERDLNTSLGRQARAQQRFQDQQRRGLLGGIGAGGVAGLAGGAGILGFLTSGFERAGQEELLQLTFTTLLQDGPKASAILQQISNYARTTSFDFIEVASSVAQLTATLGDVDEAFDITTFLSDVVALTGGTTEALGRVRLAMTQIASAGRLDAANLRQLTESLPGIPFAQILADRFFGGDVAAYSAARDAGELGATISAEAFFDAFQQGVEERFPEVEGFAQTAATTLTGLAQNLRENFAIFGAQIIRLAEGPIKGAISTINEFLASAGDFVTGVRRILVFDPSTGDVVETLAPLEGTLATIRDILGSIAKALAVVLGGLGALKLLRLAFIGITSPLGLLIIGVSAIAALWNRMTNASGLLRSTLKVLGDQIRPTARAFQQFFGLLGGAIGRRLFGDGDNNIFKKLGDGMRYAIVFIARGVVAIRHFVNTLSLLLAAGRADLIDDVIVGRFRDLNKSIGEILGKIFNIDQADIDAEGGGILGVLRNTFLEPIVNFFSVTVPEAISGLGGFLGDIFNAIFGQGGGGGAGAAFRGEEGGQGSIGTRILNVLDETFLGPVVRFFRGTFSNAVEAVIAQAVDIFRGLVDGIEAVWRFLEPILDPLTDAFRDFFTVFREEGAGAAFGSLGRGLLDTLGNIGSMIAGLVSDIPGAIESAIETVKPLIEEKLGPIWDTITGWFKDTFTVDNLLAAGDFILDFAYEIGFALGNALGDIRLAAAILAALGALALLIGSALLGVFQGVISNAPEWGSIIADGINSAIGGILPEQIFENKVLSALIGAAIIAAISAGLFIAGRGVFAAGTTVSAAGVSSFSWGKVPFGIASSLVGAIGREFQALWRGGAAIFTNDRSRVEGANSVFSGTGQKIGGALMAGIAIGIAGYQIGQNVAGSGGLILGLLTGATTGAAIGTAISPGLGTAIGATLGATLGIIGAAFGQGATQAAEMREEVDLLAGELQNLVGLDLQRTLSANLAEAAVAAGLDDELSLSNLFDFEGLAEDILEGSATVEGQMAIFLAGLTDAANAAGITTEQFNAAVQSLFESGLPLDEFIANGLEGSEVFTRLGISGQSAGELIDYFTRNIDVANRALGQIGGEEAAASIDTVAEAVLKLNDSFAPDATGRVRATADDIARMLGQTDLTSQERIEALQEVAGNARDAIGEAKDAIAELLGQQLAPDTIQAVQDAFVVGLPGLEDQYQGILDRLSEGEISFSVSEASKRDLLAGFSGDVESTITEAINAGLITSPADLTDFVGGLRESIVDAGLGDDLTTELLGQLDAIDPSAFNTLFLALTSGLQQSSLADDVIAILNEAGGPAATAFRASFDAGLGGIIEGFTAGGIGPRVTGGAGGADGIGAAITGQIGDAITANSSDIRDGITDAATAAFSSAEASPSLTTGAPGVGKTIANELGVGITANQGLVTAATTTVVNAAVLTAAAQTGLMFQVGANLGNALARGLISQLRAAALAATLVALAVAQAARNALRISSPSRVFVDIGRDIGRGFIQGIKDAEGEMAGALDNAISAAIDKAQNTARSRSAQVAAAIFGALAPSVLPGGTSATSIQNSLADIVQALGGILAQFREQAGAALGGSTGDLFGARTGAEGARLGLANALRDTMAKFLEAQKLQRDRAAFDAKKADLEAKLRSGVITKAQFDEAIEKLGERPASFTHEQLDLLRSGGTSLDPRTTAGQANIAALQQALESIRSFGQAAIQAGQPIGQVIDQMRDYIAGIIREAQVRGLNVDQVRSIIDQLGLSTADLVEYQRQLLSLDITTITGASNVAQINEQLLAIRAYAAELLGAGYSASSTADQVRRLRDQLIAQATAFGFSAAQIQALVNQAGLSNDALAEFIRQLQNFNNEAANAEAVARKAAEEARKRAEEEAKKRAEEAAAGQTPATPPAPDRSGIDRPLIENLVINPPSGDPEAIGLGVANRIFYGLLV